MMRRFLFFAVLFFAVIGGVGFGGYTLYRSSLFAVKNIHYTYSETNPYVESLRIPLEQETANFIGQPLWRIDIFQLEKNLKSKAWIENVSVSRVFPGEVIVHVEPKHAVANILKSPSQVQPVAEDNSIMDAVEISKSPSAPLLSNRLFLTNDDLRKNALQFLKDMPEDGSFSRKNISEIFPLLKNNQFNDQFKILLKNSKAEVLMNNENVLLKSARVSRVIDYLDNKDMEDRIIDANFSKKVLVRPRNHR